MNFHFFYFLAGESSWGWVGASKDIYIKIILTKFSLKLFNFNKGESKLFWEYMSLEFICWCFYWRSFQSFKVWIVFFTLKWLSVWHVWKNLRNSKGILRIIASGAYPGCFFGRSRPVMTFLFQYWFFKK